MKTSLELLVVGSSPERIRRVSGRLEGRAGFKLRSAPDLDAARKRIAEHPPNLVLALLSGKTLPELSLIDSVENQRNFPLLVLLESDDTAATVAAVNAGAIEVLVESTDVLARLPQIIEAGRQTWQERREQFLNRDYAARFGHILASALTEIYTFDARTLRIIRANRGARQNLGYSRQELLSMTPIDLKLVLSEARFEVLARPLRKGEKEAIRFETTHRRKDGSLYPVEVQLQHLRVEPPVFIAVCLDISERKTAEDQLQASEARFRSIFAVAAAGMVILTPYGEILDVNPYFCEFSGYFADELIGRNVEEITHPEDRANTADNYASLRQNLDPIVNIENRYLRKDGQIRWGHASVACIAGITPDDTYCVGLVQDITRHKEAEAKMQEAYAELDAFVHTVAHDLRAPLTPIIGMAEFLQDHASEVLDQTALSFLADIEKSGLRMLSLLEDLLSLARVGHVPQPSAPVNTRRVVEQVLVNLAGPITRAGISVQVDELSHLCLPESLSSQLFGNLIENAVRYAGAGGTPIEIGEKRKENRLVYYVMDHGPGIPKEEVGHIFEAFFRGETSRAINGTGIGLATVRKIARLYDGDVWVEETPGGGCTFQIDLPMAVLSCTADEEPSTD